MSDDAVGAGFAARRLFPVADDLDDLAGPSVGEVVLPTRLDWGPPRSYHLDREMDLHLCYERVLREAASSGDLRAFLDKKLLLQHWRHLLLPPRLRQLWEDRFPVLRGGAQTA